MGIFQISKWLSFLVAVIKPFLLTFSFISLWLENLVAITYVLKDICLYDRSGIGRKPESSLPFESLLPACTDPNLLLSPFSLNVHFPPLLPVYNSPLTKNQHPVREHLIQPGLSWIVHTFADGQRFSVTHSAPCLWAGVLTVEATPAFLSFEYLFEV